VKADKTAEVVLRFENLARRYGSTWALAGVSGELKAAELVVLTGQNGSGKSTLLLLLAGILLPHQGNIHNENRLSTHLVGHQPMAYSQLSVRRNLELASVVAQQSGAAINSALEYWGIEALQQKTLAALSRGQMQRFLLARAQISAAPVLLLDEPFTGLDTAGEQLLEQFLGDFVRTKGAVLLSEHDPQRAQRLAHRTLQLESGKIKS
jgi:ABC-type multidrug transport system ATPase subunit